MDEFKMIILRQFLGDQWAAFVAFCEDHDADADAIYVELGGEPE